jgi:hypothetical protein
MLPLPDSCLWQITRTNTTYYPPCLYNEWAYLYRFDFDALYAHGLYDGFRLTHPAKKVTFALIPTSGCITMLVRAVLEILLEHLVIY